VIRKIPCPLCQVPVQPRFLSPIGTCFSCFDARNEDVHSHQSAAFKEEQQRAERDKNVFKKIKELAATKVERELEQAKFKELEAEKKKIQELYREQASIALAKRSLLHYVERKVGPKYHSGWLHEDIARRLEKFVEAVERGESPRLILEVAPRLGKKLAAETPVLTANKGWVTHDDLQPGDFVFGSNGAPTRIVAVNEDTYDVDQKITFSNGEVVYAHREHEWLVDYTTRPDQWEVRETQNIKRAARTGKLNTLIFGKLGERGSRYAFRLPIIKNPLYFPEAHLPADPYMLGVWLGDGTTGTSVITHHPTETEIVDELVRRGYERTTAFYNFSAGSCATRFGCTTGHGTSRMLTELRAINVLNNKHIPESYFSSSVEQRLALLAGIIDTDGSVCKKTSRVSISTCSEQLRDDYIRLLYSLSQRPYYITTPPKLSSSGIQGKQVTYTICFQPFNISIPTALPRKQVWRSVLPNKIGVQSIETVQARKGKCIQVENEDGIYLVTKSLIPTHNSEIVSDCFPAWVLGQHADYNIIIASYNDELPTQFSRSIRDQLSSQDYKQIFPNGAKIAKDNAAAGAWKTEQGGGVRACGIGGSLVGFGCEILVLDDVLKNAEEAFSDSALERAWTWATSTAYSRLMPKNGIVVVAQRWSTKDLIGRFEAKMIEEESLIRQLREEADEYAVNGHYADAAKNRKEADELEATYDKWDIIKYEALATSDQYLTPDGDIVDLPDNVEPKPGWRMLRPKGESVHPERFTRNYYLKIKRLQPALYSAMYQQSPVNEEGDYFKPADFKRYPVGKHPKGMIYYAAYDLAISDKAKADYTAGVVVGVDYEGNLWAVDGVHAKLPDIRVTVDIIIDMHVKWGVSISGLEHTVIAQAINPILKQRMRERNQFIVLAEGKDKLVPVVDKQVRARPLQGLCRGGKVYIPDDEVFDGWVAELTSFGSRGVHDDRVDALAWAAQLALRNPPPRDPKSVQEKPESRFRDIYDFLFKKAEHGVGGGYMSS